MQLVAFCKESRGFFIIAFYAHLSARRQSIFFFRRRNKRCYSLQENKTIAGRFSQPSYLKTSGTLIILWLTELIFHCFVSYRCICFDYPAFFYLNDREPPHTSQTRYNFLRDHFLRVINFITWSLMDRNPYRTQWLFHDNFQIIFASFKKLIENVKIEKEKSSKMNFDRSSNRIMFGTFI